MSFGSDFWSGSGGTLGGTLGTIGSLGGNNLLFGEGGLLGGKDTPMPEMSAEEKELLSTITGLIQEQDAFNKQMMPEYAHALHYKINETPGDTTAIDKKISDVQAKLAKTPKTFQSYDQYGNPTSIPNPAYTKLQKQIETLNTQKSEIKPEQKWIKMSDDEWYNSEKTTDSERQQWDIYKETQGRQLKALRGELPLTEAGQQQKAKEFEQLKATYGITGDSPDSAVASDTIGSQNLARFNQKWAATEEQERLGQLGQGTANYLSTTGAQGSTAAGGIGTLQGVGSSNSGVASGYYSLLNPYMSYNMAGYNAQQQNQQNQMGYLGIGAGLLGGIISSKKYKTDIKTKTKKEEDKALKDVVKTRSVEYRYKEKMGLGNRKVLGAIAEEVPRSITNDKRSLIDISSKMEMLGMAIKSLNRKIEGRA